MNQAIQVTDGYHYSTEHQALKITALDHGQLIECFVGKLSLDAADAFYQQHQFDLEEMIIERIEMHQVDDNNQVWIDANAISSG